MTPSCATQWKEKVALSEVQKQLKHSHFIGSRSHLFTIAAVWFGISRPRPFNWRVPNLPSKVNLSLVHPMSFSWHALGCMVQKHNFWKQIWNPQLKDRGLRWVTLYYTALQSGAQWQYASVRGSCCNIQPHGHDGAAVAKKLEQEGRQLLLWAL